MGDLVLIRNLISPKAACDQSEDPNKTLRNSGYDCQFDFIVSMGFYAREVCVESRPP